LPCRHADRPLLFLNRDDHIRERTDIEADPVSAAVDRALELLRAAKPKPTAKSLGEKS
jgi:hypothetical protein